MTTQIAPENRANLFNSFLDLIEICDSFDQLGKLAVILNAIYSPEDIEHKDLFSTLEMTARHLRSIPNIGLTETTK